MLKSAGILVSLGAARTSWYLYSLYEFHKEEQKKKEQEEKERISHEMEQQRLKILRNLEISIPTVIFFLFFWIVIFLLSFTQFSFYFILIGRYGGSRTRRRRTNRP